MEPASPVTPPEPALAQSQATAAHDKLPTIAANRHGRDFAVGDIHGCFTALHFSLEAIGFDPAVDRLFSLGDLIDRGPESHRVVEWLQKDWFFAICGDHDAAAWRSALGHRAAADDTPVLKRHWLQTLSPSDRRDIAAALAALPLAMEVETVGGLIGLVHADCPFEDWHEMQRLPWSLIEPTGSIGAGFLRSDERYTRGYGTVVRNVRAVVHGHHVRRSPRVLGNVYYIDTGGWRTGGHFTFLELSELKLIAGPWPKQSEQCESDVLQRP